MKEDTKFKALKEILYGFDSEINSKIYKLNISFLEKYLYYCHFLVPYGTN